MSSGLCVQGELNMKMCYHEKNCNEAVIMVSTQSTMTQKCLRS